MDFYKMNNPDFEAVKIPRRNLLQPRSKENGHPSAKGETALSLSLLFRGSHRNRQKASFHKSRTGAVGNIIVCPSLKKGLSRILWLMPRVPILRRQPFSKTCYPRSGRNFTRSMSGYPSMIWIEGVRDLWQSRKLNENAINKPHIETGGRCPSWKILRWVVPDSFIQWKAGMVQISGSGKGHCQLGIKSPIIWFPISADHGVQKGEEFLLVDVVPRIISYDLPEHSVGFQRFNKLQNLPWRS